MSDKEYDLKFIINPQTKQGKLRYSDWLNDNCKEDVVLTYNDGDFFIGKQKTTFRSFIETIIEEVE